MLGLDTRASKSRVLRDGTRHQECGGDQDTKNLARENVDVERRPEVHFRQTVLHGKPESRLREHVLEYVHQTFFKLCGLHGKIREHHGGKETEDAHHVLGVIPGLPLNKHGHNDPCNVLVRTDGMTRQRPTVEVHILSIDFEVPADSEISVFGRLESQADRHLEQVVVAWERAHVEIAFDLRVVIHPVGGRERDRTWMIGGHLLFQNCHGIVDDRSRSAVG
mmetsp:Transcript_66315/g.184727  ORF Transcript_66315/g.184727 Transcript_66315/m.184727 type:complete len:221 (-) Transcript_66315:672-1334(-)